MGFQPSQTSHGMLGTSLKLSTRWILILLAMSIPFWVLFILGLTWLIQHGKLWMWFLLSGGISIATIPWIKKFRLENIPHMQQTINPQQMWSPTGDAAWKKVQAKAEQVQIPEEYEKHFESWENIWKLVTDILEMVSKEFHPTSDNSVLEVPIP